MNLKDYIEEIVDQDKVLIKTSILKEIYEYEESQLEEELGEDYSSILELECHRDADLDNGEMVECSTYSLGLNNKYIKDENVVSELWLEVENLDEYRKKYLSY